MDGGDDVVELGEDFVGVIEGAVFKDVAFDAREDAEVGSEFGVELVNCLNLFEQLGFGKAACLNGAAGVIGDAEVLEAVVEGGVDHFAEGGSSVAGGGVAVEGAAQVIEVNEAREGMGFRGFDFTGGFAEFGFDEIESECAVKVGFGVNVLWGEWCVGLFGVLCEAVLVQGPAFVQRASADEDVMFFGAGEVVEGERELGV